MSEATYQEEILNRSWGEIPEPKTLPGGSWLLKTRNASYVPAKDDNNAKALFFYVPREPMNDVSESELADLGADYDYSANQVVFTIWLEGPRDWDNLRKHLEKSGVDVSKGTVLDSLKAAKGTEIVGYLGSRTFTNRAGEVQVENTVSNFIKAE